jgi:hypothetical protein
LDSDEERELLEAEDDDLSQESNEGEEEDWESYDGFLVEDISASEIDDLEGENQGKVSKLARLNVAR